MCVCGGVIVKINIHKGHGEKQKGIEGGGKNH